MITTLLIFCFLTSLLPCFAAWRRLRGECKESSMFLFGGMALYSFIFLYGIVLRLVSGDFAGSVAIQKLSAMMAAYGSSITGIQPLLAFATGLLALLNLVLGGIILKTKRPITYGLAFIIALLGFLSCAATLLNGESPLVNFFMACCGIMAYFAYVLEMTYKEFCVIGNIYLEATICMLAALAPVVLCVRNYSKKRDLFGMGITTCNCLLHAVVYLIICVHYWMPLEPGFDLCYKELNQCAAFTHTSYIFVNIVIFVIMFVADLIFNSLLYVFVKIRIRQRPYFPSLI